MRNKVPLLLILLSLLLCACHTKRLAESQAVITSRTDSIEVLRIRVDSIVVHDSVYHLERGDSVLIERWHTAFRDRIKVDTVEKVKTKLVYLNDSREVSREVNRLAWWQSVLLWTGALAWVVLLIYIVKAIIKSKFFHR